MRLSDPYFGSRLSLSEKYEKEARIQNNETYLLWYNRLLEIAINGIKWEGLPEEIEPRFVEWLLCFNGSAIFFYDEDAEAYSVMQYASSGPYDIYREPLRRRAFSEGFITTPDGRIARYSYDGLTPENSVIIWNNYTHTPDILAIRNYARRLAELDRAIDVNLRGQKTPKMVLCDDKQRLTLQNLIKKYDGNIPFIFGTTQLAEFSDIQVLDTSVPYISGELSILKRQVLAEAMTYFGVENSSSEKRERLVTDEVLSNLGTVEMQRQTRLDSRTRTCEKIMKMFDLDVNVRFNAPDVGTRAETTAEEVNDNVNVHDRAEMDL